MKSRSELSPMPARDAQRPPRDLVIPGQEPQRNEAELWWASPVGVWSAVITTRAGALGAANGHGITLLEEVAIAYRELWTSTQDWRQTLGRNKPRPCAFWSLPLKGSDPTEGDPDFRGVSGSLSGVWASCGLLQDWDTGCSSCHWDPLKKSPLSSLPPS